MLCILLGILHWKKTGGWFNPRWVTSVAGSWPIQDLPHFPQYRLQPLCTQSSNKAWILTQKYINATQMFIIVYEYFQSSSNNIWIWPEFHALFGRNMQLQNEFQLSPNSCFARMLDWERDVTLNHGNMWWATAWIQVNPECNWDDIFFG